MGGCSAMILAGRFQGVELDPHEFSQEPEETTPSAAALSLWAQNAGMWSRAVRIRWRQLLKLTDSGPIVLFSLHRWLRGPDDGRQPDENGDPAQRPV